jgi:hypothetical protein
MPAQHSNTAGIIFASGPKRRPTLLQLYKLFREPKLNLGCVPHRPDQVHQRGLSHHYAERSLRLDDVIMRLLAPVFMFYGWPEAAMGGSSAFIGG